MRLGKIEEVDIRTVWAHEQYDFSKWLSQDENIKSLGEVLNLSLSDVNTEQYVGSYRCDIICKDELTGKSVLIENQLEQSPGLRSSIVARHGTDPKDPFQRRNTSGYRQRVQVGASKQATSAEVPGMERNVPGWR